MKLDENSLLFKNPELCKDWNYKRNKLGPENFPPNSHKKVWWKCKNNHEWEAVIKNRNNGNGCPYCFGNKKLTLSEFIKKSNVVHSSKYDYSKSIYVNNSAKIIIVCPIHGDFIQSPMKHLNGQGCFGCSIISKKQILTKTLEQFVESANEVHDFKYDYSQSNYVGANIKITIICPKHGKFEQTPGNHLFGQGCYNCNGGKLLTLSEFIKKANEVHQYKYDYSNSTYINANEKIKIICEKHGEFEQFASSHLSGHGCFHCANLIKTKTTEDFIIQANKVHNYKYDYGCSVYKSASTKLTIKCLKHGAFEQTPRNHLYGQGCKKCGNSISKKEIEWLDYLCIPEEFRNQTIIINGNKYKPDAIDLVNKIIYELYGDLWHSNPNKFNLNDSHPVRKNKLHKEIYNQTIIREEILKAEGFNIITIWESDWDNIKRNLK
jgi:hypothetical protein